MNARLSRKHPGPGGGGGVGVGGGVGGGGWDSLRGQQQQAQQQQGQQQGQRQMPGPAEQRVSSPTPPSTSLAIEDLENRIDLRLKHLVADQNKAMDARITSLFDQVTKSQKELLDAISSASKVAPASPPATTAPEPQTDHRVSYAE
jgi:hypothetical protein